MKPVVFTVSSEADLRTALSANGIRVDRPVLVCVGGAGLMGPAAESRLGGLLAHHLVPALDRWGVSVVDGGTDAGVMRALGIARANAGAAFQLVGVAARGTISGVDDDTVSTERAELEGHHTHVVLVPGERWGDESPWLSAVATAITGAAGSATLLVNGGAITLDDAERSLADGRPLVVLEGSGRAADDIARATDAGTREHRIARHELTHLVPMSDGSAVVRTLAALLRP